MKNYARIENNTVVELFETDGDIREMFHPDFMWVEIAAPLPAVGWAHIDGVFSAPPAPVAQPFGPVRAAYLETIRAIREQILNRLAGIGFAALLAADTAMAQAVATARLALLDITAAPAVLAATDIDELKTAVLGAYRAIVAAAPAALVKALDAEAL